ncbi:hypothetical protein HKX48_000084 [Thoreauomyces humboldtii]|nr:hypothetical protein HKX48_000084 [Thoreauomyces humboldtii]
MQLMLCLFLPLFFRLVGAVLVFQQSHAKPDSTCTNEHGLKTYLMILVTALVLEIVVETVIAWISLQGTVANDAPRRHMDKAIYVHSVLMVAEMMAQIYGFHLMWGSNPVTCPSPSHTELIVHLLIYLGTAGLLLYVVLLLLLFLRSTPRNVDSIDYAAVWRSRLGMLFFSHSRKQNLKVKKARRTGITATDDPDVLTDVARVFAEFLEDAETVPSDILVGVILLRREQRRRRANIIMLASEQAVRATSTARDHQERLASTSGPDSELHEISAQPHPLAPSASAVLIDTGSTPTLAQPVRHTDVRDVCYFYQYAESIYGMPLYMLSNFSRGCYHLCCPWSRVPPASAVAAIQRYSSESFIPCMPVSPPLLADSLPHADLLHLSLAGGLFRSPFVVCFDHPRQTIVIAVRGTLSTADILVDLNCDLTEIVVPETSSGGRVTAFTHSGMYRTARNLKDELESTGVLRRAFDEGNAHYRPLPHDREYQRC